MGTPESLDIAKLPLRQAEGYVSTYSNHVEVRATPWDIRVCFFEFVENEAGKSVREKKACVVMSPQHAMRFSSILQKSVDDWGRHYPQMSETEAPPSK